MAEAALSFTVEKIGRLIHENPPFLDGVFDQVVSMWEELTEIQHILKVVHPELKGDDERVKKWTDATRELTDVAMDFIGTIKLQMEKQRGGFIKRYATRLLISHNKIVKEIVVMTTKIREIKYKIENMANIGEAGKAETSLRYDNSPEVETLPYDNSPEAETSLRYDNSPEVETLPYDNSPEAETSLRYDNSPEELNHSDASLEDLRPDAVSKHRRRPRRMNLQYSGLLETSITDALLETPEAEDDAVGFETDMELIREKLLDRENKRRCVISIVGMSGIGKTTLARKVYNTSEIRRHFVVYTWISVGQDYTEIDLLKNIMKQVMGAMKEELGSTVQEELKVKLQQFLKERKYLVVLDDVQRNEVWNQIKSIFPDIGNGSRVLFTTCSIEIAKSANPYTLHQMRLLNHQESMKVLLQKALSDFRIYENNELEISEKLIKRFGSLHGSLPLALVVLGGFLARKGIGPLDLMMLKNTLPSTKSDNMYLIMDVIYDDLPYYLKPCFLFLGTFSEYSQIPVSKLISLWIAEGFVVLTSETLEETAMNYLEELIGRCLVEVVDRRLDGTVKKFCVHKLLRDFCILKARNDRFLNVYNHADQKTENMAYPRVAIHKHIGNYVLSPNSSSPNLHTLLGFHLSATPYEMDLLFKRSLEFLRVIDLEGAFGIRRLPKEIRSMIHLRYLGLKGTWLRELSSSIVNLRSLQTLDIRDTYISRLPDEFWRIETLRHLLFSRMYPPRICSTEHLQTLKRVSAGKWIEDLAKMTNLRKLGIDSLEASHGEALLNSLGKLGHLVSLYLEGESIPTQVIAALFPNYHHIHVLHLWGPLSKKQDLPVFPQSLTKITLADSRLEQDPMAMLEKLPNLRVLKLIDSAYVGKKIVCSSGWFPCLQHLELESLIKLEDWTVEIWAMPRLTHLIVSSCKKLNMLPEGLQYASTIERLVLHDMCKKFNDRVQVDKGEDWYKIRHVPSIIAR